MWVSGKAEGQGTFYHTNGDVFMGNFNNDKANGSGKYVHRDGQVYEGLCSMICSMGTGGKKCLTAVLSKDSLPVAERTAMDCTGGLTRPCTKGSGSRER